MDLGKDGFNHRMNEEGWSLENESDEKKSDKEVVLAAVRKKGNFIRFASEELKNDKEVVLEAIRNDGYSLRHVSNNMRNDKEVVLESVKLDGASIEFASDRLRKDREVVIEAVSERGDILGWKEVICDEFRNDMEVVVAAVKQDEWAFRHASFELRNNRDLAIIALNRAGDTDIIKYFGVKLIESSVFLSILFDRNGDLENCFDTYLHYKRKNNIILNDFWENFFLDKLQCNSSKNRDMHTWFRMDSIASKSHEEIRINELRKKLEDIHFKDLKIHRLLGKGYFGRTYLCHIEKYGLVVLKIFNDPRLRKKKKKELIERDSLYLPYHPNLVSVLYHKENDKVDFQEFPDYETYWRTIRVKKRKGIGIILMRYHRITLYEYLKGRKEYNSISSLRLDEICRIIFGISSGVIFLHKHMIVHRDMHTKNIFIHPRNGRVWIGDFGCALDLRGNPTGFKVHSKNEILFSFQTFDTNKNDVLSFKRGGFSKIVPPEISQFDPDVDDYLDYEKYDLYSIGVLVNCLMMSMRADHSNEMLNQSDGYSPKIHELLRSLQSKLLEENQSLRLGVEELEENISLIKKEKRNHDEQRLLIPEKKEYIEIAKKHINQKEETTLTFFSKNETGIKEIYVIEPLPNDSSRKVKFKDFKLCSLCWQAECYLFYSKSGLNVEISVSIVRPKDHYHSSTSCIAEFSFSLRNISAEVLNRQTFHSPPQLTFRSSACGRWGFEFNIPCLPEKGIEVVIGITTKRVLSAYDDLKISQEISRQAIPHNEEICEANFEIFVGDFVTSHFGERFSCFGIPFISQFIPRGNDRFVVSMTPEIWNFECIADYKLICLQDGSSVCDEMKGRGMKNYFRFNWKDCVQKKILKFKLEMKLHYLGDDSRKLGRSEAFREC